MLSIYSATELEPQPLVVEPESLCAAQARLKTPYAIQSGFKLLILLPPPPKASTSCEFSSLIECLPKVPETLDLIPSKAKTKQKYLYRI